ncbi:helix-turn-helix domain-containing protein [Streptomyces griseus]|uniref:HTH cro/C1-type domain-containing protein n=1 Tax=Streptomyces sp. CMC78 TaxID=3231512 RepID=A0AB33KJN3_9ACTN|nr:helix-turn-helix domain-containing protein [Streptomyces fimicarius]WTC88457.1 helix-turn-helix domain-containing protein [Streptomyces griseus]WTD68919.1 helix-turn-helix domain-containing protein [Streptomyces griseus]
MSSDSPQEIGRRIAACRRARRYTQTALAAASHVSYAMVRAIERGARRPSDEVLEAIADALGVDVARLRADYVGTERRVHRALPALSEAIVGYDLALGAPARRPEELADEITTAVGWRLAAQYGRIAAVIPGLLADAIRYVHTAPWTEHKNAARMLASAARTADAVAFKHGAHDLSARLIDLMRWAADRAEDPLVQAAASYVRAETFFAARAHAAGLVALEQAIEAAPPPDRRTQAAARGALHMRAAVLAGRAQNAAGAETHLGHARQLSRQVGGEGCYLGTAFGPESVRIHEVSVAVSLGPGHVDRALRAAEAWDPGIDLPAERRSGFYIELARAQDWAGRPVEAFNSLRMARAAAPQHTREHPWTREVARSLRRFHRSDAESLTHFAHWAGAV